MLETKNQQKNNAVLTSWTAPEFIKYDKGRGWFITLGIISLGLIFIAFFMKNFLFALIIVLTTFLIYAQGSRRPRKIKFAISDKGILIDQKEYFYNEFKSFWIFEEPERILSLMTKKLTQPSLSLPLGEQRTEEIRKILIRSLPERKQEETLSDIIARKIKL